jgi:hypothetical protein
MDNVLAKSCLVIVFMMASIPASATDFSQPNPLSYSEWDKVRERVELLDKISFVPSLLPVIMKHQDALNLSDDQRAAFRGWRKQNYKKMVDLMNEIIEQRIALSKAALDPSADSYQLISQQETILQLQERLLRVRLSCRELVLTTFSPEQWGNLAFVLEEYPNFAGLMQQ